MASDRERPLVSVYVTSHNYGRFLAQCLDSVLAQTLTSWELLIFNDGSSDNSLSVARTYEQRESDRIRVFTNEVPLGLRVCANEAIRQARGRYLIRLDADDYLDPSALLVLSHALETNDRAALAYPNWIYVNEAGDFLGLERRKVPGTETVISDLPPHGACTMVRLRALKVTGGYDESFDAQDGHELWLKLLHRYDVVHVQTPLFSYRQHGLSMSRNEERLLSARRAIKRQAAGRFKGSINPRVVAIVPVKNTYAHMENIALSYLGPKPLIDHTIDEALASGCFEEVLVTTDDPRVIAHCDERGDVTTELRHAALSSATSKLTDVVHEAIGYLECARETFADAVVLLGIHTPLRRRDHIVEAVDTLLLYDVDHVISVYEDFDVHFRHGRSGMEAINPGMVNKLRYERESLFVDNGAIHVMWRDQIEPNTRLSGRVGHIVMARSDSMQIKSNTDRDLIASFLQLRMKEYQ